jgi:hypothetical protein
VVTIEAWPRSCCTARWAPPRRAGAARRLFRRGLGRLGSDQFDTPARVRLTPSNRLFFSQSRSIVGAAGAEAARSAMAAGDFSTVYQCVAVFDLLGMVAATVRARGHLSPAELHVPDGMRLSDHVLAYG